MPAPRPTRRHALAAGLAGLPFADLLRLRADGGAADRKDAAVIFVLQEGGASQFETWDPKPDTGSEIRGDFGPIRTTVPGVLFSEAMAEQARLADKMVVLRAVHHPSTQHSSSVHLLKTGYYCAPPAEANEMPSCGAVAARVCGPVAANVPPFVVLNTGTPRAAA